MLRNPFLSLITAVTAASLWGQSPTPIRKLFGPMTAAKLASIPDFVLPAKYRDRAAHPLPASVDLTAHKYMPPYRGWSIQGWSCANATAVSFVYGFEVQRVLDRATTGDRPFYAYNYTYHFLNNANQAEGGDGWMFVEAFDILKETGGASTADFGGFDWGNPAAGWMSGYAKYHRAMGLRADQYYKIDASSAANDELIKQYLLDQAEGSPVGGLLTFQANSSNWATATVNGKRTFTKLGGGGGHALNIAGYDDAHDGGSYICVNNWGDGVYYAPYRLFRAGVPGGLAGPQGTPVMFCRVKRGYAPKLAFRITLTHDQRNAIAILTGAASSAAAAAPARTKDYAGAFNFAGGPHPMAGKGLSATLEFGLDLTDFAPELAGGQGRLFLHVVSEGGEGRIDSVTLMDYTGPVPREIPGAEPGKAIGAGATTTVSIPWTGAVSALRPAAPRAQVTSGKPAPRSARDLKGRAAARSRASGAWLAR